MPSDALAQNLGRLNNSIEKLFPMLNAVVNNNKNTNSKDDKSKLDKSVKAMSSGVFMSIIIDNVSSKEVVKATDSMKSLISSASGLDTKAVDSFKRNITELTTTLNSIKLGNATSMNNLRRYISTLSIFINSINSLNSAKTRRSIKNINDLHLALKHLNSKKLIKQLSEFDELKPDTKKSIKLFVDTVSSFAKVKKINTKNLNNINDLNFTKFIKELDKLAKINPDTKVNVKLFADIIMSLGHLDKINAKKIANNLNKLSGINVSSVLKEFKKLSKLDATTKDDVMTFVNAIESLSAINKLEIKKLKKNLNALSDLDLNKTIAELSSFNKIDKTTEDGLNEFVKIVESLDTLENINARKAARKLKRLFKSLNSITIDLEKQGNKKIDVIKLSGIADFINAAKTVEKTNVLIANFKIKRLKKFFSELNSIIKDVILGKDSPLANGNNRKQLTAVVKSIDNFMKSNEATMKIMAANGLLGLPALLGAKLSNLVYKSLIQTLNELKDVKIDKNTSDAIKNLSIFALSMAGVVGIMVLTAKLVESTDIGSIGITFGVLAATTLLFGSIAVLAKKFDTAEIQGAKNLGVFAMIMVGVTGSIILLSKLMKDATFGSIAATFTLMAFTAVGLLGIAKLANKIKADDIVGLGNLGILAGMMVGVTLSIILLAKLYEGTDPKAIWSTFGLMTTSALVLTGIAALNALVSTISDKAIVGAGAMAIMALTMIGTTYAIIEMTKEFSKVGFNKIMGTLGTMTLVSISMIGLAAALGYAVVVTGPAIIGAIALAAVAAAFVFTIKSIVDIHKSIENNKNVFAMKNVNGKKQLALMETLSPAIQGILELGDTIGETSLRSYIRTKRTLKLTNDLLKTMGKFVDTLVKFNKADLKPEQITEIASNMSLGITSFLDVVGDAMTLAEGKSNRTIRKTRKTLRLINKLLNLTDKFLDIVGKYSPNKNNENRNIINDSIMAGETISKALLGFVDTFFNGFDGEDGLEIRSNRENKRIKRTLKNIKSLVKLVPDFLNSIKQYKDSKLSDTEVQNIATSIANSLNTFTETLFNKFETLGNPKTIKKQIKNLKKIIKPVSSFVDMITSLSSDGDKLGKIRTDDNGKVIDTIYVDVKHIADVIANTISNFLDTLYSDQNIAKWDNIKGNTGKKIGKLLKVIDPINSFIDLISKYNINGTTLEVLDFNNVDAEGNPKVAKKVDVALVSTSLATTVTTFLNKFYNEADKWDEIAGKKMNKANRKIGKLTQIIDPISSFIDMLGNFSSNGALNVIDPATGKITEKVPVKTVAENIANTIKTFLTTLYSHEDEWNNISGTSNSSSSEPGFFKKLGNTVINGIQDIQTNRRLGKLGMVLDPINTFMALMTSYKWNGTSLETPNGTIDLTEAGNNIALGIKTFTDSVYNSNEKISDKSDTILKLGNDFSSAFQKIDSTLEKSKNDARIREIKRLSEEFGKLSTNMDKMINSSDKVADALNNNTASNVAQENTNVQTNSSSNSNVQNTSDKQKNNQFDYDKLAKSIETAINTGISDAFKNQYKFKANCTYDKTMQEFVITRN